MGLFNNIIGGAKKLMGMENKPSTGPKPIQPVAPPTTPTPAPQPVKPVTSTPAPATTTTAPPAIKPASTQPTTPLYGRGNEVSTTPAVKVGEVDRSGQNQGNTSILDFTKPVSASVDTKTFTGQGNEQNQVAPDEMTRTMESATPLTQENRNLLTPTTDRFGQPIVNQPEPPKVDESGQIVDFANQTINEANTELNSLASTKKQAERNLVQDGYDKDRLDARVVDEALREQKESLMKSKEAQKTQDDISKQKVEMRNRQELDSAQNSVAQAMTQAKGLEDTMSKFAGTMGFGQTTSALKGWTNQLERVREPWWEVHSEHWTTQPSFSLWIWTSLRTRQESR